MKKLITLSLSIIIGYFIFDAIHIFTNHFDLYERPKPYWLIAWYPMYRDAVEFIYWGNDVTAIWAIPVFFSYAAFSFLIPCFILKRIIK